MLLDTRFPAGIDYIEVDVKNIDNFDLLQEYSITSVPVLAFENGNKLIGMKSKKEIEEFLNNA
jgi:predicted DsbA family dithiol-disulfide isomerase